jgi:hypothetical protein
VIAVYVPVAHFANGDALHLQHHGDYEDALRAGEQELVVHPATAYITIEKRYVRGEAPAEGVFQ